MEVEGTVLIGRRCEVGDGTHIANSCIDNFTKVGRDVLKKNPQSWMAHHKDGAGIKDSIIGGRVTINSSFKKQRGFGASRNC
jgi:NDP-sugar pyrophosphorylase family protein